MVFSSRRSSSRPTDWAQLFADAQRQTQEPPPGWLTVDQWATRIGRNSNTAGRRLAEAIEAKVARREMFKPKKGGGCVRVQAHYWVNGVSDEIARGVSKNKRGRGITSR